MSTGTNKLRAVLLASLMVLWVLAGTVAFAGGAAAGTLGNTSITVGNTTPGATNTAMNVTTTLTTDSDAAGSSLNGIKINPDGNSDINFSGVTPGVDSTVTVNGQDVSDDVSGGAVENGGSTLTIELDGSTSLSEGDIVKTNISNVDMPTSAGDYQYDVVVNPSSATDTGTDTVTFGTVCPVHNLDQGTTYDTISNAVSDANSGDTIEVCPGTYDGVSVGVSDLTLLGPNAGTPGDADRTEEATIEGPVAIDAPGVVFDGFDVSPPAAETSQESEAIKVAGGGAADDVVVRNNIVRNFKRSNNSDTDFWGVDGINVFGGDSGSSIDAVENVTITDNTVYGLRNEVKGGAAGISVQGAVNGATVESNKVRDVGMESTPYGFGIVVRGTGNNNEAPKAVSLNNNTVDSVLSDPSSDFFGVGLGVESNDASEVIARGNEITNVGLSAENKDENHTFDARGNYWGSDAGPSSPTNTYNKSSQTAPIVGDVAFTPWLDAPRNQNPTVFAPVTTGSGAAVPSIQAGVDAADANGTVSVQPGIFAENVEVNTEGVSITSTGNASNTAVYYKQPEDTNNPGTPTFDIKTDGVTVQGFTVVLNTSSAYEGGTRVAQGIKVGGFQAQGGSNANIQGNNVIFDGERNENITTFGIGLIDPNNGATLDSAAVNDNTVVNFEGGVGVFQTDDGITGASIDGNDIRDNANAGLVTADLSDQATNVDVSVGSSEPNTFAGNPVHVQDDAGSLDFETLVGNNNLPAAGAYVGGSWNGVAYNDVQSAVNDASSGDTVRVSGTLEGAVTVNETDLTLRKADNAESSILRYDPEASYGDGLHGTPTVNVVSDGATLRNFSVERPIYQKSGTSPYGQGVRIAASNVTVQQTDIFGASAKQSVTFNDVLEGETYEGYPGTAGIAVLDTGGAVNNVTFDTVQTLGFDTGILVTEFMSNGVSNVDIGPAITAGNDQGLVVKSHSNDSLTSDVSVTSTTVALNDRGVFVPSNETYQGYDVGSQNGSELSVTDSTIQDNNAGVVNNGTGSIDATNNFWGAFDGPSGVANGSGDSVSENITYEPFEQTPRGDGPLAALSGTADPATPGETATYNFTAEVDPDGNMVGKTLNEVNVLFEGAFFDNGGSLSSVSDDQNVGVVINHTGGTTTDLTGTDQVTVADITNSNGDVIGKTVNISQVDDAEDTTLDSGDTVKVTLDSVTNPSAADYKAAVRLAQDQANADSDVTSVSISEDTSDGSDGTDGTDDSTDGTDDSTDGTDDSTDGTDDSTDDSTDDNTGSTGSSGGGGGGGGAAPVDDDDDEDETDDEEVDIPAANVSATDTVNITDDDPDSPGVTVMTGNNTSVRSITFSNETTAGNVTVNDVEAPPEEAGSPPGQTVRTVEINVPEEARNQSATFEVSVDREDIEELNASEDELTVTRYNESAGEWQELNTSVAESGNESVTLEAETPGFSFFAVTAQDDETDSTPTPTESTPTPTDSTPTQTATATDTTDDMTTDEPTETASEDQPGFGAIVALVALLAAALLAARRQQ